MLAWSLFRRLLTKRREGGRVGKRNFLGEFNGLRSLLIPYLPCVPFPLSSRSGPTNGFVSRHALAAILFLRNVTQFLKSLKVWPYFSWIFFVPRYVLHGASFPRDSFWENFLIGVSHDGWHLACILFVTKWQRNEDTKMTQQRREIVLKPELSPMFLTVTRKKGQQILDGVLFPQKL